MLFLFLTMCVVARFNDTMYGIAKFAGNDADRHSSLIDKNITYNKMNFAPLEIELIEKIIKDSTMNESEKNDLETVMKQSGDAVVSEINDIAESCFTRLKRYIAKIFSLYGRRLWN